MIQQHHDDDVADDDAADDAQNVPPNTQVNSAICMAK